MEDTFGILTAENALNYAKIPGNYKTVVMFVTYFRTDLHEELKLKQTITGTIPKVMRFPVAYYLLLLYLTVMLKPLMPLISDAWDHTFSESIHIATVHAKYGANHLQSVIADNAADSNANSKSQSAAKPLEVIPLHIPEEVNSGHFVAIAAGADYNYLQLCKPPAAVILKNYPPPKVSS